MAKWGEGTDVARPGGGGRAQANSTEQWASGIGPASFPAFARGAGRVCCIVIRDRQGTRRGSVELGPSVRVSRLPVACSLLEMAQSAWDGRGELVTYSVPAPVARSRILFRIVVECAPHKIGDRGEMGGENSLGKCREGKKRATNRTTG